MLIRSLLNVFNIIPLLVIVPFAVKILMPEFGMLLSFAYLIAILLLLFINNFIAVLLGFLGQKRTIFLIIPFVLVIISVLMNRLGFKLENLSIAFGRNILQGNLLLLDSILAALVLILYLNNRLLSKNFYIDELNSAKSNIRAFTSFGINNFNWFGETGRYLSLETSLLFRNKRPRQMMVMVPFFLVYFLFMIFNDENIGQGFPLIALITMLTGIGASMYGQYMFSWESSYFDSIMARKNDFLNYVKAKYYLLCGLSSLNFIALLVFFSITKKVDLYLLLSIYLFIIGVNSFTIMFFATFNDGRIDIAKSRFFNYQGIRGSQFILTFIFILLPLSIYSLISYLTNPIAGKLAIAIPGLVFTTFHHWWLKNIIVTQFKKRKYKNLEGYRKLSF